MTSTQGTSTRPQHWAGQWLPLVLALLLAIPALWPLGQPGLQQTDDGMHHLFRLFNLNVTIRAGHPGTRWLADEGFGYGFPVFNFYAPLSYYATLALHWTGLGLVTSLEWALGLGIVLAAFTMYLFARELFGPWGAGLSAVAYTWTPYHIADSWTRGALAEQWAFVYIPLLLLALLKIVRLASEADRRAAWGPTLWGSLALAGLVLTHNLTVLLVAPVLIAWALFLLVVGASRQRLRCLGHFTAMALLGLMLSAAFWLPAAVELRFVLAGHAFERFEDWVLRLPPPRRLFEPVWFHPFDVSFRPVPHPLSVAQMAIALLGFGVGLWRWRRLPRLLRRALPLWFAILLFALFLQTDLSKDVWRAPGMLILQFYWRWQVVVTLVTAMLSGYLIFVFPWALIQIGKPQRPVSQGVLIAPTLLMLGTGAALISATLPGIYWTPSMIPTTEQQATDDNIDYLAAALYDFGRGLWLREYGSVSMFEFMPMEATPRRADFFLSAGPTAGDAGSFGAASPKLAASPLAVQVVPGRQQPLQRHFTVTSRQPWTMQLHQFYFSGWEATVNGLVTPARPTGDLALVGVALPAGRHDVVFRFGMTAPRRAGWTMTVVGLAVLGGSAILLRRWGWLVLAAALVMTFSGLALRHRMSEPTDYVPNPISAIFGSEAQLVGYHLDPKKLRPGSENLVTLNWLALSRPRVDYKVFLHLVDLNGTLWAQHDGEPVFNFAPTTRWQPGEFIEDRHFLTWHTDKEPPPGRYLLFAGLYDLATGQRLPVTDLDGRFIGDQVLLGEFDLP